MQKTNLEGEVFFDSYDISRTSFYCASSFLSLDEEPETNFRILDPQWWTSDMSVSERRKNFVRLMGFDEFVFNKSVDHIDLGRPSESSGAALNSFSATTNGGFGDSHCCIRDLDRGRRFTVHELGENILSTLINEVGSGKFFTLKDFEKILGLSHHALELMQKELAFVDKHAQSFPARKKHISSWWRSLISKRPTTQLCPKDVAIENLQFPRTMKAKVLQHRKSYKELTVLFIGQEIQAHNGLIRTMKFSPSGCYIASGGEYYVVRIWQIKELDAFCKHSMGDCFGKFTDKIDGGKSLFGRKGVNSALIIIPKKVFRIMKTHFQEFHEHTNDILDLSWSTSDCLINCSMDKTVRMWTVGFDGCLQIFQHNDYGKFLYFMQVTSQLVFSP
ncbi:hypothetical protein KSP40_PGU008619 [Platanthera guangdongensis]|uniref:WD repeat-containing protein 44 n=1 Tax=Platanthera guangdongensis TaxID=2320717 RepID=A0ABR2LP70_9ASPA